MTVESSVAKPMSKMGGFTKPDPMGLKVPKGEPVEEPPPEQAAAPSPQASTQESGTKKENEFDGLSYLERLKLIKVELEEALEIIDRLATEGRYSEGYKLSPSIKGQISSRSTRFNSFLSAKIDLMNPKKVGRMNQLMSEYQLAASLDSYGEVSFPVLDDNLDEKAWEEVLTQRHAFVKQLSSHVFVKLCALVSDLDIKLTIVLSQGYEDHF